MRVLILDGHSRAALESAQSLGRRGAEIDLACESEVCLAFASRYVANRLRQPPSVPADHVREWLVRKHGERNYDLIVPSTDVALNVMRSLEESHPVRTKAVLPGSRSLDIAVDKLSTYRVAQALGIALPHAITIPQHGPVPECERYPVVLKSRHSRVVMAGVNRRLEAVIARDATQRERVLASWLPYTAVQQQEFVFGRGFGIEMLFDRGRALWHFAHERVHEMPLTGGGSSYRRSIAPPPHLLQMAERLLGELSWHGAAMVEFRGDGRGRDYLMEINPRLWGSLALPIDCGVDFPAGLAALATAQRVPAQPRYRIGYFTRDLASDVQWHKVNLRADHHDPLLLTRGRLASTLELLRPLYGRESWDFFDWSDLAVTRKMLKQAVRWELARFTSRMRIARGRRTGSAHHQAVKEVVAAKGCPRRLLFLCYGNICRSPLAALMAERELSGVRVVSAGFQDVEGRSPPGHVCRAANGKGLDLGEHLSRRVRETDVKEADLILCMDLQNLESVRREFPEALTRTTLLGLFAAEPLMEIADPYWLSVDEARHVIESIRLSLLGLSRWLENLSKR